MITCRLLLGFFAIVFVVAVMLNIYVVQPMLSRRRKRRVKSEFFRQLGVCYDVTMLNEYDTDQKNAIHILLAKWKIEKYLHRFARQMGSAGADGGNASIEQNFYILIKSIRRYLAHWEWTSKISYNFRHHLVGPPSFSEYFQAQKKQ